MTVTPLCPTCRGDCCSDESGSLVVAHGAAFSLHCCLDCPDGYALAPDLAAARLAALLDAERENTALRVEVERLRELLLNAGWPREAEGLAVLAQQAERAAVVAWLRERQEAAEWALTAAGYEHAADAIERGDHRREEGA